MGTSRSARELAGKLDRLARAVNDPKVPLDRTALAVKRIMESTAAQAGVLGNVASGKRKAVQVRYNVRAGSGSGVAIVAYTGPAHLFNNPTRPHVIAARRLGLSRRRSTSHAARQRDLTLAFGGSAAGMFGALLAATRTTRSGAIRSNGAQALTIGGDLRAYARHPGTRGKQFMQRARPIAEKIAPQVYGRAQLTEPLRRTFG